MDLQWPTSSVSPHIETSHQSVITGELLARPRLQRSHPKIKEKMDVRHCIEASNKLRLSRVEQMIRDPSEWILHLMDWAYPCLQWSHIPYFYLWLESSFQTETTWILLTSACRCHRLNSTNQQRNNELFYHLHVFTVQTFGGMSKKPTAAPSKQVKLSCIAPVESGHCIFVKWCMPWTTLQNLMTYRYDASLLPPNHFHTPNHQLHLKKPWRLFLTESQQHTFHISWYKRFIASKAMRRKFFSISFHPFEQMPPKWTHTQALWKQDN